MQQQIRFCCFLQGGLKCFNQTMRQIANETHGVRKRHRATRLTQIQLTGCCVKCCEQLISSKRSGFDQRVKDA